MLRFLFIVILFLNLDVIKAQSYIKVGNLKINYLDRQKRKQGDWIFFDKAGNVSLSCFFKDDVGAGPLVFYENSDTVFVRLPLKENRESFILYKNDNTYYGDFIHIADSTELIEIEPDSTLNENIISEIKKYQNILLPPVYHFSQKRLFDYVSGGLKSSNFIFNKPINVQLTLSSSGLVTNVDFPRDKNNLSGDEERELRWIYTTMPRWQPFFTKKSTQAAIILLSNNSSLSILSF